MSSILGNSVIRVEDPKFLTVGGTYVNDVRDPALDGAAHVSFVRSTMAHARIVSIDTSEAASAPGVIGVFTAEDLGLPDAPPPPAPFGPDIPIANQAMLHAWLARDVVRHVGQPIVAIVAETPTQGADAVELVYVDYDPLPAVIDPEESVRDETLIFPDAGTNVAVTFGPPELDGTLFDGCEVVVSGRLVNQRLAPVPMEMRGIACAWGDDGRVTFWSTTQAPHIQSFLFSLFLGLEPGAFGQSQPNVRVIAPDVGGGFGAKVDPYVEDVLTAVLARRLERPMRWTETRSESMLGLVHGRGQIQNVTIGGLRDGTVLAYRLEILQDGGAFPMIGTYLPLLTSLMASGVYKIPKVETTAKTVVTNTTTIGAYRGAGRPEATYAIERAMDLFAGEIGMDPADVRRKNFAPKDGFPYQTATGIVYDIGDYEGALDRVLEASGYRALREEQRRRREAGDPKLLGIGLSSYVEITAGDAPNGEYGRVDINDDGSATVYTGSSAHGQGHATSWTMIVAEETGIPLDRITVVHGDSDIVSRGTGTFGSRSLQMGGAAVHGATLAVVDKAREIAASTLEADPQDVVLDRGTGRFHVAGTPGTGVSWAELASSAAAAEAGGLTADQHFVPPSPTFPFGSHVAVVEVDSETGDARLTRIVAVDDAGRIINPLLVHGQLHGGIAQGVAQALFEEMRYDEDGMPLTGSLMNYHMVAASELPSFEIVEMETPTPVNPLGAKGVGESGTIGSIPAVQNAVIDALSHLGIRHVDMPATPERVWRAISGEATA